jgi:hypothetical protein
MNLRPSPHAPFSYVPGIDPYSGGVVAAPGAEIVHVTLAAPVPWRRGFERIEQITSAEGLNQSALCAIELRCPRPHSFEGFIDFNDEYRSLLGDWGLLVGDDNPIARTNVAPAHHPPDETSLHAFSYVRSAPAERPASFVVAGAGDLIDQSDLQPSSIVAGGAEGSQAWRMRIEQVCQEMEDRMSSMGVEWKDCSTVDVYCAQDWFSHAGETFVARIGSAIGGGLHWYIAHPPIEGLSFEMDVRRVSTEKIL